MTLVTSQGCARTVTTILSRVGSCLEVSNAAASPSAAPCLSSHNFHYFCFHILRLCWEKSALLHMALRNLLHQPNACKAKAINKSNIHGSGIQHSFPLLQSFQLSEISPPTPIPNQPPSSSRLTTVKSFTLLLKLEKLSCGQGKMSCGANVSPEPDEPLFQGCHVSSKGSLYVF